jgi:hypothetical protein
MEEGCKKQHLDGTSKEHILIQTEMVEERPQ